MTRIGGSNSHPTRSTEHPQKKHTEVEEPSKKKTKTEEHEKPTKTEGKGKKEKAGSEEKEQAKLEKKEAETELKENLSSLSESGSSYFESSGEAGSAGGNASSFGTNHPNSYGGGGGGSGGGSSSGTTAGSGLPTVTEPVQGSIHTTSAAFQNAQGSFRSIMQSHGDADLIDAKAWTSLAQSFGSLSAPEQKTIKQALNQAFPSPAGSKSPHGGGDALQYASDGIKGGDLNAPANRLADLQKQKEA